MTIQDIRDEIVEETGGDSSDTTLLSTILTCIKGAIRQLPTFVRTRTLTGIETVSLGASANSASLPDAFIKERAIYRKTSEGKPVELTPLSQANRLSENPDETGTIYHYWIIGKTIYFNRKSAASDTIYIDCFKNQVTATFALGDNFFGNANEVQTVKNLAKETYYGDYEEDEQKAARAASKAIAGLEAMEGDYLEKEMPSHVEEA